MHKKLKDYESITIHGWMINKLQLRGLQLMLFAALWNYCLGGTKIEWSWLDDICSWLYASGYNIECEDLDPIICEFVHKGWAAIDKEGILVLRHIKELDN